MRNEKLLVTRIVAFTASGNSTRGVRIRVRVVVGVRVRVRLMVRDRVMVRARVRVRKG